MAHYLGMEGAVMRRTTAVISVLLGVLWTASGAAATRDATAYTGKSSPASQCGDLRPTGDFVGTATMVAMQTVTGRKGYPHETRTVRLIDAD
jgi:hypothetical protein